MTRPESVRLKEDPHAGARFAQYVVGSRTGEMRFLLEPEFVDEYIAAAAIDESLYRVAGRPTVPPQILTLYLMGTLHRRYPPLPGIVMARLTLALHGPLWRGETKIICCEGEILSKEERGTRHFIRWQAEYREEHGPRLATITNTFLIPDPA